MRLEALALRRGGSHLRVRRTGVGPERVRSSLARLELPADEQVVVAGLCGSLDPTCRVGDVVVPSELRFAGRPDVRGVDAGIAGDLRGAGFAVHEGPLVGADHAVTGEEREALGRAGSIAVDMESSWIAEALPGRSVTVVRVVLDAPGQELFRFSTLVRLTRCLGALSRVARVLGGPSEAAAPALRRSS